MSKGQYGEPWRAAPYQAIVSAEKGPVMGEICGRHGWTDDADKMRAVACVNALDGLNPEALAGVLEAAEALLTTLRRPWEDPAAEMKDLRAALAQFKEARDA